MFTIRVYGILLHNDHVLVSDEIIKGRRITKFPGGGLEYGEGVKHCLVREIREEMGLEALDLHHFYTTDFFQQSTFHSTPMQVISVYFTFRVADPEAIPVVNEAFGDGPVPHDQELFRWLPLAEVSNEALTLPIDRVVWGMLRGKAR
jgi:ADP-ribose pyrophosphatase YjhB (NUDIX family)